MALRNDAGEEWKREREREFLVAYESYADAVFRHALARIRDREAAKDIAQEAFSRAWLYLAQGKRVEHMRAFLYRIAGNLVIDTVRKRRTSSLDTLMEEDGFEPEDESAPDPADRQATRDALALLSTLDETSQTVISMRYLEGMSPKEIAAELGVSENVVSVRIHRALGRLRERAARVPPKPRAGG